MLDAVEQAIWTLRRKGKDPNELVLHHNHGSQHLTVANTDHSAATGIKPTTGVVGSTDDNVGRVGDLALQDRVDREPSDLEGLRRLRQLHLRVNRLVQPPPPVGIPRRPHTRPSRAGKLRSPSESGDRQILRLESPRTRRGRGTLMDHLGSTELLHTSSCACHTAGHRAGRGAIPPQSAFHRWRLGQQLVR